MNESPQRSSGRAARAAPSPGLAARAPRVGWRILLAGLLASAIGCGGGGGGGSSDDADSPAKAAGGDDEAAGAAISEASVAAAPHPGMLEFDWVTASGGASVASYELQVNSGAGYVPVESAGSIVQPPVAVAVPVLHTNFVDTLYRVVALDDNGTEIGSSAEIGLLNQVEPEELIGYFKADSILEDASGGRSVALSGDGRTLAVGAPMQDAGGAGVDPAVEGEVDNSGAVYVFRRAGDGRWQGPTYLKAIDAAGEFDRFGSALALDRDGDRLAVAAYTDDGDTGAVHLYERDEHGWAAAQKLTADSGNPGDYFGWSVDIDDAGDTLVVGESGADDDQGTVHLYQRGADGFEHDGALVAPEGRVEDDWFGSAVALNGDGTVLAVGAPRHSASLEQRKGKVVLFDDPGADHPRIATIEPGDASLFGASLALDADGDTLAIGAPYRDGGLVGVHDPDAAEQDAGSNRNTGAVHVYGVTYEEGTDPTLVPEAYVKSSTIPTADDLFGRALALSADGDTLAVGVPFEDGGGTGIDPVPDDQETDSGAVHVYARDEAGAWAALRYLKAVNAQSLDQFGTAIALSDDGGRLAVGAPGEDSELTGANPDIKGETDFAHSADSGATYLY